MKLSQILIIVVSVLVLGLSVLGGALYFKNKGSKLQGNPSAVPENNSINDSPESINTKVDSSEAQVYRKADINLTPRPPVQDAVVIRDDGCSPQEMQLRKGSVVEWINGTESGISIIGNKGSTEVPIVVPGGSSIELFQTSGRFTRIIEPLGIECSIVVK